MTSLVSTRPESLCPPAQTLVMKVVLMPGLADDRAVKLAHQDVEEKYTIPQLIVVLLKVHVEHMELWLADHAAVVEALCLESLESADPT